jgi:hypothetical protein
MLALSQKTNRLSLMVECDRELIARPACAMAMQIRAKKARWIDAFPGVRLYGCALVSKRERMSATRRREFVAQTADEDFSATVGRARRRAPNPNNTRPSNRVVWAR